MDAIKASDGREYVVESGTFYNAETPAELVRLLERCRINGARVRLHYGDTETGQDWGDVYGVYGRVSRSMGPIKIPILIENSRSMGGAGILTHCIVRVRYANRGQGGDLYRHPNYTAPDRKDYLSDAEYRKHFA